MEKKFRTKNQRHIYDDEKRRQSLLKKLKYQQSQKEFIKNALSDSSTTRARKLVFDNEILEEVEGNTNENGCQGSSKKDSVGKPCLFDETDSEKEENYEIKIKSQFEGKKGHKLLSLQSTYNNDERFRLDERFKDDDSGDDNGDEEDAPSCEKKCNDADTETESNDLNKEKTKQLKVLETVLGRPVQSTSETEKKPKKSFFAMVRFDASNEDHKRQQNDVGIEMEGGSVKKKKKLDKKERKKRRKEEAGKQDRNNESKTTRNSEKKFYEVSDDLKSALKNRRSENGQFSLLAAFSRNEENEDGEEGEKAAESEDVELPNQTWRESEDDAVEGERQISESQQRTDEEPKEVGKVHGIAKEKFFLTPDDPRIEEALAFMNMKNSEEAGKAIENYDETRRDIREVLRLRWQKHRQRNNPFKKKIGGSNKKKMPFTNNRKQFGKTLTYRKH